MCVFELEEQRTRLVVVHYLAKADEWLRILCPVRADDTPWPQSPLDAIEELQPLRTAFQTTLLTQLEDMRVRKQERIEQQEAPEVLAAQEN